MRKASTTEFEDFPESHVTRKRKRKRKRKWKWKRQKTKRYSTAVKKMQKKCKKIPSESLFLTG